NGNDGIQGQNVNNTVIQGNYIGTDVTGTLDRGNASNGIWLDAASSANSISNNVISGNTLAGVRLSGTGSGNTVQGNSIYANGGLGIDLVGTNGVTPNDSADIDIGPNGLQNFPVIGPVTTTSVSGTLNSTPATTFTIEVFASAAPDPSGYGEGQRYLGSTTT